MKLSRFNQAIIIIILTSFFFTDLPTVHAQDGEHYSVGVANLNVRSAPANDAEVIAKLDTGTQVVVFKESHGWAQTYYGGQVGWVASQYLYQANQEETHTNENEQQQKGEITITTDNVRIRSGPGTENQVLQSASHGQTHEVLETSNDWQKITLADGSTGWIAAWLTSRSNTSPVKPQKKSKKGKTIKKDNHKDTSPKQETTKKGKNNSQVGYNIVLDPGHGGRDPGSKAINGIHEKDLLLATANNTAKKLREAGATVIITRESDRYLSLEERVSISNVYNTHAFISLHYDAHAKHSINGFSTHFYSPSGNDRQLAQDIQSGIAEQVDLKSRGIMQNDFYVLRENSDLAVLVELGFLTNQNDLATIQTDEYQVGIANGITTGLLNYFD